MLTNREKEVIIIAKNITYQMTSAIDNGFRPGMENTATKNKIITKALIRYILIVPAGR